MRPRLATLKPRIAVLDQRIARPVDKQVDPHYSTMAHRVWREDVKSRAAYRCEYVSNGVRCTNAAPQHRMFADHIVELKDGGSPTDPLNGQCLCARHHTLVTAQRRRQRAMP